MRNRGLLILSIFHHTYAGCPFGNPFYFLDVPIVSRIRNPDGNEVPDRVRISWGKMKNFKCVDYFQVEYWEDTEKAVRLSDKINRHHTFLDLTIQPCTDYMFKVVASEDWQGMREDFKVSSDLLNFRVETEPQVVQGPVVREVRKGRGKEGMEVRVGWSMEGVAWSRCVRIIEFQYYDSLYNESLYTKAVTPSPRIDFRIPAERVPCHHDFLFIVQVEGVTGGLSFSSWTPPSCVMATTTTSTSTTTTAPPIERMRRANIELKNKIGWADYSNLNREIINQILSESLKQDYHPIGQQVYKAIKDSFLSGFESFINKKKILDEGNIAMIEKLLVKDPFSNIS